ncbi:uncharacterized protein LOC122397570 [Colletes gigas]|uniref:uncharacterized protein LOC122397570 n=1 Tax=Colletes gigas TaxID=935657 RepID=UPI001C9ADF14|nr:uncharacterized protein LOC122397570 [Colletes gigas]
MVVQRIAILLLLITQVLSAPSGCIESCGFYSKQFQTGSQIPSNIQGYNDLTQTATRLQGLDYSRPGTWSEHNDYNTNNGNGKIHEEHGQIVDGPKTVRYYKKNYSSSYSTGNTYGAGLPEIEHQNNYGHGIRVSNAGESFNSQQAYNQIGNIESSAQQREYNRIQSQQHTQSSVRRANTQSERLEDFGEYGGSSQGVQDASDLATQISQKTYSNAQPRNWSKVDSYGTDGGHGQVFEEEGQYVSGPKKVRYYKRNYTSSSGLTSSIPISIPISEVTNTGVENINREIEKFHRETGKEFNQISSTRNTASSNIAQTNIGMHELASDNLYSNTHRSQIDHGSSLSTHHNEEHLTDTVTKPYINPTQNTYGANSFSMYERHEGYVPKLQPSTQFINPTPGYTNVLSTGNSGYNRNIYSKGIMQQQTDNMQETQLLDSHQSRLNRDQITDDNMRQNIYTQNRHINTGMPGRVSHYKEHWSSSHMKETSVPHYSSDISHTNEQGALYNNRYRENSFNSGHQTTLEKLRTGEFELSQMGNHADCTQGTTDHVHTDSQLHRKYKRSPNSDPFSYMQQSDEFDDLTQQTSGKPKIEQESQHFHYPWGPSMNTQQSEDLTQQTGEFDDLTQKTSGELEFGPPSRDSYQPRRPSTGNQQTEDLTQQTGEFDDLTQQTSGKLEFGPPSRDSYQPRKPNTDNQQTEDWTQQTGELDDLTQQTSGKLEFGPPSRDSYQPRKPNTDNQQTEDWTQQTGELDDLTQQTSGKLEFGPPSRDSYQPRKPNTDNQQTEDWTQQTGELDDLTQQTSGKLEFGPPSRDSYQPRRPSTGNQQTGEFDDLTQQTSGKLEFGPPSRDSYQPRRPNTGNQQTEDWTQQTGELDDLTQQTSGKLEFGTPSRDSYQPRRPSTGNQQTGEFDDLTQQTSGKLEFGPPSRDSYQPRRPNTDNQQTEDWTQQTGEFDDLTQQTSGKLEFGPPSRDSYQPRKPNTGNQQTEDWTQQTGELDDLTQQTSGKLEFGPPSRDSYQPRKPNTGNQQTGEFDDLTQQTSGKLEFGPPSRDSYQPRKPNTDNQQTEDWTQQTGELDDLTQQTSGKLEFGSQSQDSYLPRRPNTNTQQTEDLTQQTGEFDDLTQQTSGKLEFGQQSMEHNPYFSNSDRSRESVNMQNPEVNTQRNENFPIVGVNGNIPVEQQVSSFQLPKPAGKPKPRSRYSRIGVLSNIQNTYNSDNQQPSHPDANIYELPPNVVTEADVNMVRDKNIRGDQNANNFMDTTTSKQLNQPAADKTHSIEEAYVDSVNSLHKSNDATVGLQWHYTYHPSDQRQFIQQTDQRDKGHLQQQSSSPEFQQSGHSFDQQETQNIYQQSSIFDNEESEISQKYQDKSDNIKKQSELEFSQQRASEIDDEQHVQNRETKLQLEPRIIEVYGGGPYDASHNDDIYSGITVNPSATLLPINNADPWDIHEKPREVIGIVNEVTSTPMSVKPLNENDETTHAPSFWSKLGSQITTTYGKAKEKARTIFG